MKGCKIAALLAAILFGTVPLCADTVSDSLTVFDAAGKVVYSVSVTEALEDPSEIYFINVTGLADANNSTPTTLLNADGSYSDIFGVAYVNGDYFLGFNSDTESAPAAYGSAGSIFLAEGNGGPFDATVYLDPSYQAQGYTARFFSDADVVVPEPGSLNLLAGGLLGLGGILRRRLSA